MSRLPVIVGFGGYNAAGRSSFHHGFRRIVQESLDAASRRRALWHYPLLTLGVMARIHWHALLLWAKRAPFHRKPAPPLEETT